MFSGLEIRVSEKEGFVIRVGLNTEVDPIFWTNNYCFQVKSSVCSSFILNIRCGQRFCTSTPSAVGHLYGALILWAGAALVIDATTDKNILGAINCCSYVPVAVGGVLGSTHALLANPHPPVNSLRQGLPFLLISGVEMALYPILFGGPGFRNGDSDGKRRAILGSLALGLSLIPLSHTWYFASPNQTESMNESFQAPRGLVSWNKKGLAFNTPGFWMEIDSEPGLDILNQPGQRLSCYLSLVCLNF